MWHVFEGDDMEAASSVCGKCGCFFYSLGGVSLGRQLASRGSCCSNKCGALYQGNGFLISAHEM